METQTESSQTAIDFLSPLSGWEAAARWNRATFDWVAKGWQQWLALMTTVPPQFVVAPEPVAANAAAVDTERAVARSSQAPDSPRLRGHDEGAPARKRKPKAAAKKAVRATKARARG